MSLLALSKGLDEPLHALFEEQRLVLGLSLVLSRNGEAR